MTDSRSVTLSVAVSLGDDSTSALILKYHGVSGYYVCSDYWTSKYFGGDGVCHELGYP